MLGTEDGRLSLNSPLYLRTVLIACNVKQMSKDIQPSFSAEDIAKIKKFSKTRSKVRCPSFRDWRVEWNWTGCVQAWPSLYWITRKVEVFSSEVFGASF